MEVELDGRGEGVVPVAKGVKDMTDGVGGKIPVGGTEAQDEGFDVAEAG